MKLLVVADGIAATVSETTTITNPSFRQVLSPPLLLLHL
jgi:hypothetical protein